MRKHPRPSFPAFLPPRTGAFGAIFVLAEKNPVTASSFHDPNDAGSFSKRRRRVLVVEDHRQSREALSSILACMGFEPISANTLGQAERLLKSNPDFVILDLMLPDGSGIDVLQYIRSHGLPTKVAVATGTNDPEILAQVEQLHPDAFFMKPLNLSSLMKWLNMG